MSRTAIVALLTMSGVLACASAGDRFEEGLELEASGDAYAAALRYIDALDKDASLTNARVRLEEAGGEALRVGLADAASLENEGAAVEAGRTALVLDELIDAALGVGVTIPLPTGYDGRRVELLDGAADALFDAGRRADADGAWREARDAYSEIRTAMATTTERANRAREAEAMSLVRWSEDDLERARFRSAFDRAEDALELEPSSRTANLALMAQESALESGTVYVAVLPTTLAPAISDDATVPADFGRALDDALELDQWTEPPLFVRVIAPAETRRALRAGGPIGSMDEREVRLLLSDLDADVAAIVEITELVAEKSDVEQETVDIPVEGGGAARTRLEKGRLRYTVRADVEIVDARGRRIRRNSVSASASDRYELGVYAGDVRALQLNRRQREHFDPEWLAAQRRAIQERAAAELAEDVARRVFDGALGAVG